MTQQKTFRNYQRMLSFLISLCYEGRKYQIWPEEDQWRVTF